MSFTLTEEKELTNSLSHRSPVRWGKAYRNVQRPDNWRFNHDLVLKPNHAASQYAMAFPVTGRVWYGPNQNGLRSTFGFPGITGDSDATPRVQFTGADGLTPWGVQDGKVNNGSQFNITYHFNQQISLIKGKHEFKMGWDIRRLQTTSAAGSLDLAGSNGQYFFAPFADGAPDESLGNRTCVRQPAAGLAGQRQSHRAPSAHRQHPLRLSGEVLPGHVEGQSSLDSESRFAI